jgi:hypothetical protein
VANVTQRDSDAAAVSWLLASDEPAVRLLTCRDLLGHPVDEDRGQVLDGRWVRGLLQGQQGDGSFGVHPYRKWTGAHWRLVSLVELAVPADHSGARAAATTVLDWLTGREHRARIRTVDGLVRRCASQEGNAVAVACRLGLAGDPRVEQLARSLIQWQWPDGGWNCDVTASGRRSSFHESLIPMWGLYEYAVATGDDAARAAAARTAELLLDHHLFRSVHTGAPIDAAWVTLHYPPYWHYDILHALVVLGRMGLAKDPRANDALDRLEQRRLRDGRWRAGRAWWSSPGSRRSGGDAVDWGRSGPSEMVTLGALRALNAAGRFMPS